LGVPIMIAALAEEQHANPRDVSSVRMVSMVARRSPRKLSAVPLRHFRAPNLPIYMERPKRGL
jgi:hypothetical protein